MPSWQWANEGPSPWGSVRACRAALLCLHAHRRASSDAGPTGPARLPSPEPTTLSPSSHVLPPLHPCYFPTSLVDMELLLLSQARECTGQIFQILTVQAKKAKHNSHVRRSKRVYSHQSVCGGGRGGLGCRLQISSDDILSFQDGRS